MIYYETKIKFVWPRYHIKKGMSMKATNLIICLTLLSSSFYCFSANDMTLSNEHISDPIEEVFTDIYRTNKWESPETVSGPGSTLKVTKNMRQELSELIKRFGIISIADAPCGDCNWMKYVDIGTCTYVGIDIVRELIESNTRMFAATRKFRHLNLLENIIEKVDLIICRDMIAHLTYEQIFTVLRNFKKSGSKYILITTGVTTESNYDIEIAGDWRKLNLELPPFNFPRPLVLIQEDVPFEFERGKHLGLWFLEDLKI